MKKTLLLASTLAIFATPSLMAYDAQAASTLHGFYSKLDFDKLATSTLFLKSAEFAEKLKKGEKMTLVDVRTPQEQSFVKLGYQGVLEIPLHELFAPQSLAKIPTDLPIVVVCHSGTRAVPAAFGLKMVGFKNVQVLENGIVGAAQISAPASCPVSKK